MNETKRPAGLILSAGFSSRMNDFKPLMKIGGRCLLEILVKSCRIAGLKEIFVVVGHNAELVREYLAGPEIAGDDINIVVNEQFADGMFTSVKAGVRAAAENGNDCVLMTPVDIPLIPPYVMKAALDAHYEHPEAFIVPCFNGKKGHPICIPAVYFDEILENDGENGLKSITSKYEGNDKKFIKTETHAEGIVLDMDTQEAYAEILDFYEKNKYPDEEKCWKILHRIQTPGHIVRHCLAVSDTAIAIAEELNKHGWDLSISLIKAAGMLHDVLRIEKKHWEAGAKLVMQYGYPEVADIIEAHMNYIPAVPVKNVNEKDIICLSDKLRQEDRLVTLDERLEPVKEKWKDDPEALAIIASKINAADATLKFIEKATGTDIYEMLREKDRIKKEAESHMPKAKRLVLVRHGETEKHDGGKIFLGQTDVPLNGEGKDQCEHVGLELQHFDIDTKTIFTSDLLRARQSAEIIANKLGDDYKIVEIPEFREMNLGHWDGMYMSDVKAQMPDEFEKRGADLVNYKIDDEAENFVELQERVMKKLNELIAQAEGDMILVSHSGVLRVIKCALHKRPLSDVKKMKFDRGTYDIIEIFPQEQ